MGKGLRECRERGGKWKREEGEGRGRGKEYVEGNLHCHRLSCRYTPEGHSYNDGLIGSRICAFDYDWYQIIDPGRP